MTRTYIELSAESRQAVAMDAGLNWEAEGQVMNRDEWLRSDDPAKMLAWLIGHSVSDSKLLAVVEACRLFFERTTGKFGRTWHRVSTRGEISHAAEYWCGVSSSPLRKNMAAVAAILRDIIGDPFAPVTLPRSKAACRRCRGKGYVRKSEIYASRWDREECDFCGATGSVDAPCPWLTPEVASLADAAYTLRAADGALDSVRLCVLADCLTDAGCDDSHAILSHLRSGGPHYRGMWSLDLLLGKA